MHCDLVGSYQRNNTYIEENILQELLSLHFLDKYKE